MPSDCSSWWYIVNIKRTFSPTKRGFLPEYIIFFDLIFPNFVPMPFHAFVGLWLIFHLEHNLPPPILCLWLFYLMRWKKNTNEYYYSLSVSLFLPAKIQPTRLCLSFIVPNQMYTYGSVRLSLAHTHTETRAHTHSNDTMCNFAI